jgi:hypothetical protein
MKAQARAPGLAYNEMKPNVKNHYLQFWKLPGSEEAFGQPTMQFVILGQTFNKLLSYA